MIHDDLAEARSAWLDAAKADPDEYERRTKSDFLAEVNHEGERLDFHSLRHTCGAWLAMTGAHPKAVQSVRRHSTITLTMDAYGHLFPGQETETVARLPMMMGDEPEALRTTGTADVGAQQYTQQRERDSARGGAGQRDEPSDGSDAVSARKAASNAANRDVAQDSAVGSEDAPGRTRTCDPRFRKPVLYPAELRALINHRTIPASTGRSKLRKRGQESFTRGFAP